MIEDYTAPSISYTLELVQRAHAGQRYGDHPNPDGTVGRPYVEHVVDVSRRLRRWGTHAVLAGLLHDIVEDASVTCAELTALSYPDEVVLAVDAVSWRAGEPYDDLIARAAASPLGCLVKMAANRSNFEELEFLGDRSRAHRLTREYRVAFETLLRAHRRHLRQSRGVVLYGPLVPTGEQW